MPTERLDQERRRKLRELAAEQGAPVSETVRRLIDSACEETLRGRRQRAAYELGRLEIEDVPDQATLSPASWRMPMSPAAFLDANVPIYAGRAHLLIPLRFQDGTNPGPIG